MMSLSRMLLVAPMLMLSGASYAADKITLICSGTRSIFGDFGGSMNPVNTSLVIDLDKGVVSGLYGCSDPSCSFAITEVTETLIKFKTEDDTMKMHWGEVNRITGDLSVIDSDVYSATTYSGTCKPANALLLGGGRE
jgi:hypothetical protein